MPPILLLITDGKDNSDSKAPVLAAYLFNNGNIALYGTDKADEDDNSESESYDE